MTRLALCAALAALLVACGDSAAPSGSASDGGSSGTAGGGPGGPGGGGASSSTGAGGSAGGLSEPTAGIPSCAPIFVDPDGVCRPTLEKCPAGQMPKFDTGCAAVGIPGCAAAFQGTDGFCHPSFSKCATGEFPVPSEGCVSIDGAGCGTDTWGTLVAQTGDQHVDPTTTGTTPDGSRANPWKTIADALAAAADGKRVVLAAGTYAEPFMPTSAVSLVGRCASMVTVSGTATTGINTVIVAYIHPTSEVSLSGLTISGAGYGLFTRGATVNVDGVVFDHTQFAGISANDASHLTLHHIVVRGTAPFSDGTFGTGTDVYSASAATIRQSAWTGTHVWGVSAGDPGTAVDIADSTIEGTLVETSDHTFGYGLAASFNGAMTVDKVAMVGNAGPGISTYDADSMKVTDSVIEKSSGPISGGITVARSTMTNPAGDDVTADGVAVLDVDGPGVLATSFAKATLTRTLVQGGKPIVAEESDGFRADKASSLDLTDCAAVGNTGIGLLSNDMGTQVTADGLLLEGQLELTTFDVGEGVTIQNSSTATLSRIAALSNVNEGIGSHLGSSFTLVDSIVSGTKKTVVSHVGDGGEGVYLFQANGTVTRTRVESSVAAGVAIIDGACTVTDVVVDGVAAGRLVIRDNVSVPVDGAADGILVARSATAPSPLSHVWIRGAARAGVLFANSQGTIDASSASDDLFGLVTQGTPLPTIGGDNEFSGSMNDVLMNGTLPAP